MERKFEIENFKYCKMILLDFQSMFSFIKNVEVMFMVMSMPLVVGSIGEKKKSRMNEKRL